MKAIQKIRALPTWNSQLTCGLAVCLSLLALSPETHAQGKYVNFEVGPVHPVLVETFSIGDVSRTVVMVCNTPNNALEFYDADPGSANVLSLIKSVPTGLAPVTVRWDGLAGVAYTCDQIGDSLTKIAVSHSANGSGGIDLAIQLVGTYPVGDEPCDVLVVPSAPNHPAKLLVSLRSRSALTAIDPVTMTHPSPADQRIVLRVPQTLSGEDYPVGAKNPGPMELLGGELYVLDRQSDDELSITTSLANGNFSNILVRPTIEDDLDMYVASTLNTSLHNDPLEDSAAQHFRVGKLGTTHHHMVASSNGEHLFVVGMDGRASDAFTEPALDALKTGFAQSWMWVLETNSGAKPTKVEEDTGMGSWLPSINLNRGYDGTTNLNEVQGALSLAQPTGVALLEDSTGAPTRAVITAFSSDKVAVLIPSLQRNGGWAILRVNLDPLNTNEYAMAGPRGVAVDSTTGIAYVACSLDNSLRAIDVMSTLPSEIDSIALERDPTPANIRKNRHFLYSAEFSRAKSVSCSSCHIDGHTDGIVWTLNPADNGPIPDSLRNTGFTIPADFPDDKGPMMTQSLRGLVNYDIEGEAQDLATNAPYHWRGDRLFHDFDVAFPGLLGGGNVSSMDMAEFTEFVETIVHPPNPEQPFERKLLGSMGPSASPTKAWDPTEGTGTMQGMKLFHVIDQVGLSCVHCHAMPEGSGNRITNMDTTNSGNPLPLETAAIRNIFDFEPIVIDTPYQAVKKFGPENSDFVRVKTNGLFHEGSVGDKHRHQSINHFAQNRFRELTPGQSVYANGIAGGVTDWIVDIPTQELNGVQLSEFVRQLDTGTSPSIGWSYTYTTDLGTNFNMWRKLYNQVREANAGMVIHSSINGVDKSYWFDLTEGTFGAFRFDAPNQANDEVETVTYFTHSSLIASGATFVMQGVPVGSARNVADRLNLDRNDSGPAPSSLELLPMAMATHWEEAGNLKAWWDPAALPPELTHFPTSGSVGNQVAPRPSQLNQIKMQDAILLAQSNNPNWDVGLTVKKHEPPRRIRVSGDGIRQGAILIIGLKDDSGNSTPMKVPVFPTGLKDHRKKRIWESSIEIDGEMTLALLCGGPYRTEVKDLLDLEPGVHPLTPVQDNKYDFMILNTDFTFLRDEGMITIQNTRY